MVFATISFVTGQIYTDRFAPKQIRAQAQGMLVLFTLGLGMFIGAQIAGNIEAKHTPEAAATFAAEVAAKTVEAQGLKDQLSSTPESEKEAVQAQIAQLEEEAGTARKAELKSLEWKPLWGKPAIFAAIVMVVFLALFKDQKKDSEQSA